MAKAEVERKQPRARSQLTKEPRKDASKLWGSDGLLNPSQEHTLESYSWLRNQQDVNNAESDMSGQRSSPVKQGALNFDKTYSSKDTDRWGKDVDQTYPNTLRAKNSPGIERHSHSSSVNLNEGIIILESGEEWKLPKLNQWDPPAPTQGVPSYRNTGKVWGSYSSNVNLCKLGGGHSASRSRDKKTLTEQRCRTNGRDRSISPEVERRKSGWHQDRFNSGSGIGPTRTNKTEDDKENEYRSNAWNQTDCNARNQSTSKLSPHHGSNRSRGRSLVRTNRTPGGSPVRSSRTPGKSPIRSSLTPVESLVHTKQTPGGSLVRANRISGESGSQPGQSFPCIKIPDLTIKNEHEGWGPCSPGMTHSKSRYSRYSPPFSQTAPELKKSGTGKEFDTGDLSYLHVDRSGSRSVPISSQATHCSKKNSDTKVHDWWDKAHDQTNLDVWSPIRSNSLLPTTNGGSSRRCIYYYSPLVEGTGAGQELDSIRGRERDESSNPGGTLPALPRPELSGPIQNPILPNQVAAGAERDKEVNSVYFKWALAAFVKPKLRPFWEEQHVTDDTYRKIANVFVGKVIRSLGSRAPQTAETSRKFVEEQDHSLRKFFHQWCLPKFVSAEVIKKMREKKCSSISQTE